MQWQDWFLTVAQTILIFALIPTVLSKQKPAVPTCLITTIVVFGVAVVYTSLSLWMSAITALLNAVMWLILSVQSINLRKKR